LILHGESIGGMAAASTASKLSSETHHNLLLVCDRTFGSLPNVASRLVGSWTTVVIPILTPLWNTNVTNDFLQTKCPKIVAQDASDLIVHDSASLKAGLAYSHELSTQQQQPQLPLQYRMADWENVGVYESTLVTSTTKIQAPIWPQDKHISQTEAMHFAACSKRIAKVATAVLKNTTTSIDDDDEEEGIEITTVLSNDDYATTVQQQQQDDEEQYRNSIIVKVWETLARCDGMTGMPLGPAVKGGYDCVVTWLYCMVTFGCQKVAVSTDTRRKKGSAAADNAILRSTSSLSVGDEVGAKDQDFTTREATTSLVHADALKGLKLTPLSLPEVLEVLNDLNNYKQGVKFQTELNYCIKMFEYLLERMKSQLTLSNALSACNFHDASTFNGGGLTTGCFIDLHCGHNNQYSEGERRQLQILMTKACNINTDHDDLC